MADKQSREVEKGNPELWRSYSKHTNGGGSEIRTRSKTVGSFEDYVVKEGDPSEVYIGPDKPKKVGEISVKVNVDVSEALTGLKALQREAREATKALRELEEAQNKASSFPRYPFEGHPNTPPDHVKKYGKSEGWAKKAGQSGGVWFDAGEGEATQSITDDIRRSYEMGGEGD